MKFGRKPSAGGRLAALASRIEKVVKEDAERIRRMEETAALRRRAAAELHALCAGLVAELNALLSRPLVELSPPEFAAENFREDASNVFQINISGRIVHLEFHSVGALSSTDKFPKPYILEGAIRAFNQEMLELSLVPEQRLFCCAESGRLNWLWVDPRTQRAAPFDRERLTAILERLV